MHKHAISPSLLTHPAARRVRGIARRLGLTKLVARALQTQSYEERFATTMLAAIRPGDIVWDVGANQGYYTALFSNLVGPSGHVVAFEPTGTTFATLSDAIGERENITLVNAGLSNTAGNAEILVGADELAATSRVASAGKHDPLSGAETSQRQSIRLERADTLLDTGHIPEPTVIKIDVEGHEWNVLDGLGERLCAPKLRRVLIEVHFSILDADGRSGDVDRIVAALHGAGFTIEWTDPSHINASRKRV